MFFIYAIILFELIILVHEFGHFILAKIFKIRVKEFSIGFGPVIIKFKGKKTDYCVRAIVFGGFTSFQNENEFLKTAIFKRVLVILAGPFFNFIFGLFLIASILLVQGRYNSLEVQSVNKYCDGIKVCDNIKMFNNHKLLNVNDFLYRLNKNPVNDPVNLTVERENKILEILDVGRIVNTGQGNKKVLGFSLKQKKINIKSFLYQTFTNFLFFIRVIVFSIFKIFCLDFSIRDFVGPLGIIKNARNDEKFNLISLLFLFSFLSVNIGIFNMLPIFALDGGQLLFLFYEFIFKKPINPIIQNVAVNVGFVVLLIFSIIITIKDFIIFVL